MEHERTSEPTEKCRLNKGLGSSEKHLRAYLDEFEFRFNNRENPYLFRDTLRRLIGVPKLEYRELIENSS